VSLRIGALELGAGVPLVLAPLAGYSDVAHRAICRDQGADLTVTEMASADGLALAKRKSKGFRKTLSLLTAEPEDHPLAAQLFGKEPHLLAAACGIVVENTRVEMIDLNAGCPVRKVVHSGHGVALMRDPSQLARIVTAMRAATDLPLTVKLRSGAEEINVVECARLCQEAGADAVTVHPRTRAEMFAGKSDWTLIAAVKQALSIPVIGNGDVKTGADAAAMVRQTGCDAVMIGRAAVQRPWVFAAARAVLDGGEEPAEPGGAFRMAILRRQVEMLVRHKGLERAGLEIRKFALYMVKGKPGAAAARQAIATAPSIQELLERTEQVLLREGQGVETDTA
jgi:tRNA-dihydrouridine synthase B